MAQKNYTAKDIQVLDEMEHIRLSPGMYIGSTENPTHLIEEVLDNSLDEAMAGYATIIAVMIDTKENRFSILDNGRGIPIEKKTPVTISTKLFSGGKFQDRKTAYEISSGLHGIGLIAVNALSEEYSIEIFRNEKHALFAFKDGKLKTSKTKAFKDEVPFSTKIEFVPDKKYFHELAPDLNRIRRRLTTASAELSNDISFVLVVDDKKEVFNLNVEEHFISSTFSNKENVTVTHLVAEKKPEKFEIIFGYDESGGASPKTMSCVNLLPVNQGGSHVASFQDTLKDFFMSKAKKYGFEFQPNDVLFRLRAYLTLKMVEPKFSSQTKEKLTNHKSEFNIFEGEFKKQLEAFAKENEELMVEYLSRFAEYRRKIDSKKLKTSGSNGRRASTQFTKLRDCTGRNGELYIVEGDSAAGSLIQSRNPRRHAILPLRGKSIPNVTTKKSILDNKEVGELIRAIGTGIDPDFDLSKMRYDKIICATDADHDGNHIACLVTMAIAILLPEIIRAGRYYIAQTPLYAINEKKMFKPLWTERTLKTAREKGRTITRFKGLGELSPHQLKICLVDDKTRNLIPIKYSDNIEDMIKLFSSAEEKRKLVT